MDKYKSLDFRGFLALSECMPHQVAYLDGVVDPLVICLENLVTGLNLQDDLGSSRLGDWIQFAD